MSESKPFLDPLIPSFWKYDGEAFEWTVIGSTIALVEEVTAAATFLDHTGCPDLEDLLLFLAAFSPKYLSILFYGQSAFPENATSDTLGSDWEPRFAKRCENLQELAKNPPSFPEWKFFLASQTIGKRSTPGSLRETLDLGTLFPPEPPTPREHRNIAFQRFVRAMHKLLDPDFLLDKDRIEHLWLTSVDRPPSAAALDLPGVAEDEPSLFDQLRLSSKPAAIAVGVAEALWPAFSVKGRLQRPQDLPLGGFADLSNKGALDRLLPTELAFDDAILAARIVSGEALYLRREAPPVIEQHRRLILADCGIRMWGIRRVISTGVALAVARAGTSDVDCDIMTCSRTDAPVPGDFSDPEGVTAHLASLSPAAHPSPLVQHGLEQMTDAKTDVYLLTTGTVLDDPEFNLALTRLTSTQSIQIISISPEGHLQIFLQSAYGRKLLQEITIDLDAIIDKSRQPVTPTSRDDGPAFHAEFPLPLRIGIAPDLRKAVITSDDTLVAVSRTRDLFHWDSTRKGARCVSTHAPKGVLLTADVQDDGVSILSVHATQEQTVLFLSAPGTNGHRTVLPRLPSTPRHAFVIGPIAILLCKGSLIAVNQQGRELHRLEIITPSLIHRHTLVLGHDLFQLTFTDRIVLTPIPPGEHQLLFQWKWRDKSCQATLTDNQTHIVIHDKDNPFTLATPGMCSIEAISPFGDAVVLRKPNGTKIGRLLDTKHTITNRAMEWVGRYAPRLSRLDNLPPTLKNFRSLTILDDRTLGLFTRKNALFTISAEQNRLIMRHDEHFRPASFPDLERHPFTDDNIPTSPQGLQCCSFPGIADLWLDARGFLHFSPADRNLADLSLALSPGTMSGWTENHGRFGIPGNEEAQRHANHVFEIVLQNLANT